MFIMSYNRSRYRNYEFAESLRDITTESGANTFTEEEVITPVGRATNMALAVFGAMFEFSGFDTIADGDKLEAQLTKNSKSAIVSCDNSDFILGRKVEFSMTTSGAFALELIKWVGLPRPKIYANSKMYLGMKSTGQAAANSVSVEIIYVLRSVHPTIMNRALTD